MRYFAEISFDGTNYVGWQHQSNGRSVQSTIEEILSKVLQTGIDVVGCGRTDAGVHASQFIIHFDTEEESLDDHFAVKLNRMLPADIAVRSIRKVDGDAHARHSALTRSYRYVLITQKDPFRRQTAWLYPFAKILDSELMQNISNKLMAYEEFKPFCKTGSDTPHYKCVLSQAEWTFTEQQIFFDITANRFLRGMVRLIVGTMLMVGRGKLNADEVLDAMNNQQPLPVSESAPPHALFLSRVTYADELFIR